MHSNCLRTYIPARHCEELFRRTLSMEQFRGIKRRNGDEAICTAAMPAQHVQIASPHSRPCQASYCTRCFVRDGNAPRNDDLL